MSCALLSYLLPGQNGVPDIWEKAVRRSSMPGKGQSLAGKIGSLNEGKTGGQVEGLIHVHCGNDLSGQNISPGVPGDNQGKDRFIIKAGLAEQGGQAVDKGGQVGGQGVIVVGAQQNQSVCLTDGRVDLLLHDAPIEAAPPLPEVEAHGVGAAGAVGQGAVAQADLLHLPPGGTGASGPPPDRAMVLEVWWLEAWRASRLGRFRVGNTKASAWSASSRAAAS